MPLRILDRIDLPRLTPSFDVLGQNLTMITPLARSIDKREVLGKVTSLETHEYEIKNALDMPTSGSGF